ncbi:MAG TPA: TetR/AcrR family transcriptional regulator [Symbiobacteriaceae bacterium]|jgi:AcrR family transcriptional regulator
MSSSAETRDRLLAEALKIFSQKGFDRATIGEIARSARIAEGTIYRHFESKKDLFIACVEPAVRRVAERIVAGVAEAKSPVDIARAVIRGRLEQMVEDRDTFNILFTGMANHPELFELMVQKVLGGAWATAEPLIQRLTAEGKLRRRPNFLIVGVGMTAAMWAMINFQENLGTLKDPRAYAEWTDRWVDDMTDFVLYGMAGQPAGGDHT